MYFRTYLFKNTSECLQPSTFILENILCRALALDAAKILSMVGRVPCSIFQSKDNVVAKVDTPWIYVQFRSIYSLGQGYVWKEPSQVGVCNSTFSYGDT